MSKSCSLAFAAVVICLPMIVLSGSDAGPPVGNGELCSASQLEKTTNILTTELEDVKNLINEVKNIVASDLSNQPLASALVANCVPLLIQQNVDGSDFFNRSWAAFKVGFSDARGNFWLGNDLLSQLTLTGRYKLRFDLQSRANSNWYYAVYNTFTVSSEANNYALQVAGYSGNAGQDSFGYHEGMMFSAYDRDNDRSERNCAATSGGGFWHKNCAASDVNTQSFGWIGLPGGVALQTSRMWLQCQ